MRQIYDLLTEIHAETQERNETLQQDEYFFPLLAGLDTAEDASEALLNYETQSLGNSLGEKYLRLYGFLQAAFIHQDAIARIWKSLMPGEEATAGDAWKKLRKLRNMTVGHPVSYGYSKDQQVFISRMSISDAGFRYEVWDKTKPGPTFLDANLSRLYGDYKQEARTMLERILASLQPKPQ
jgi:hypothetical protein